MKEEEIALHAEYTGEEVKTLMKKILDNFLTCGQIGVSCDRAGVRRKTHHAWMEKYPRYKELVEDIQTRFWDNMEVVAHERAKEKSDALLMFLLKANRPDKFRDSVDVNNKGPQAPIQLIFADGMLNAEEKKLLGGGPSVESPDDSSQG
jgi:hypothetical protein